MSIEPPVSADSRARVDAIAEELRALSARIDASKQRLMELVRELCELKAWAHQGAKGPAQWLSWAVGWSEATARERVRVARALGGLPRIDEALRSGTVSYSKVRAMTRVATPEIEELLLLQARTSTGAMMEKLCRGVRRTKDIVEATGPEREVRRRQTRDGMVKIEIKLFADEADAVWKSMVATRDRLRADAAGRGADGEPRVSAETRPSDRVSAGTDVEEPPRPATQVRDAPEGEGRVSAGTPRAAMLPSLADAVLVMAEDALNRVPPGPRAGADRRTLFVHVQSDQLLGEVTAETHDHRPLRMDTLRKIACDCGLVAAVRGDDGHVLALSTKRRTVSEPLRRALMLRDRHCAFPGCQCRLYLEAHHVRHWLDGGETRLDNLVLLCWTHHALLHREGFRAENIDGKVHFYEPSGREIPMEPQPPPYRGDPTQDIAAAQGEAGVHIDARTALPEWDGTRRDIPGGVDAVVRRTPWGARFFEGNPQRTAQPPPPSSP